MSGLPGILQQIFSGNFSAPLTLVFLFFTLLAFYFLFRLGLAFFVRGDAYTDSEQGKREINNNVRLLFVSLFVALFAGFIFEFVAQGRQALTGSAPGAAQGFFDWLIGKSK